MDELFVTEQTALDAFIEEVEEYGIDVFIED